MIRGRHYGYIPGIESRSPLKSTHKTKVIKTDREKLGNLLPYQIHSTWTTNSGWLKKYGKQIWRSPFSSAAISKRYFTVFVSLSLNIAMVSLFTTSDCISVKSSFISSVGILLSGSAAFTEMFWIFDIFKADELIDSFCFRRKYFSLLSM